MAAEYACGCVSVVMLQVYGLKWRDNARGISLDIPPIQPILLCSDSLTIWGRTGIDRTGNAQCGASWSMPATLKSMQIHNCQ